MSVEPMDTSKTPVKKIYLEVKDEKEINQRHKEDAALKKLEDKIHVAKMEHELASRRATLRREQWEKTRQLNLDKKKVQQRGREEKSVMMKYKEEEEKRREEQEEQMRKKYEREMKELDDYARMFAENQQRDLENGHVEEELTPEELAEFQPLIQFQDQSPK
ncbi:hypothetical protein L3Y34_019427 [Caenorhabditis briggsae]|uniref:Uncharacterized protein n=1 Tax=Caenorhabditis briggsae TaxID=6238 RepID=A0AAE9DNZ4_CAEBR|nr:hypothetical protein L3Y34_019427 [Caenorhabditis briggsae]